MKQRAPRQGAGGHGDRELRVLVIDDETDAKGPLEEMLQHIASKLGRKCRIDWARTWNARGITPSGLRLFCQHAYDLVVLDLVFSNQPDQGDAIYEAIRFGLEGYRLSTPGTTPASVPILLLTKMDEPALDLLELISTCPRFALTFILRKKALREGRTGGQVDALCDLWSGRGLALHVLVPAGAHKSAAVHEMMFRFCQRGATEPARSDYDRPKPPRHACQLVAEFTSPNEPPGKQDWACRFYNDFHTYLGMSLTGIKQLCWRQTGYAMNTTHPNGQKGWKKLDGVGEIVLHFDEPGLFGLSVDRLVLSDAPGAQLFVPEGLWPADLVGRRIEK